MNFTRVLVALLAVLACAVGAASASAATLHATPANFASTYAGAAGGDTILLASGSYGAFNGGVKSSMVTIDEEAGASASFSSSDFASSVRNLTVKNVTYTGTICITAPSTGQMGVVLDGITIGDVGQGCNEGRIGLKGGSNSIGGAGVQIKNSHIGPGGCSDGIQDSMHGAEIGPGNEFTGISQSCGAGEAHVDALQPYDGDYAWIHDNYFHDNEQGIMSPDGLSTGYLIENNVIHTTPGYPCMHIGDSRNGTIRHNVCRNGSIRVYEGNQGVPSQNMTVQNNIAADGIDANCSGCTIDHNLTTAQTTFTQTGSGRCYYATASPKGTASDGTDIGLNDCGGSQPPADSDGDGVSDANDLCPGTPAGTTVDATGCPVGNPPVDHTPVARFTASPEPSYQNESVTFDASASTCDDAPCTYTWADTSAGGPWPLGPAGGGMVITQVFTGAHSATSPVMATLTVTDADGDTNSVEQDHVVNSGSRPSQDTTPPDTTITSGPTNGTSTTGTVSFTGTDNVGVDHFDCRIDGGAYSTCSSPKSYTGLAVGSHTIDVKAVDAAGNSDPTAATVTWTISVPAGGPPTFKAEYETAWSTAGTKSVSVPVVAGDVLVAYAGSEDAAYPVTLGGSGLTWTLKQSGTTRAPAYMWTATAASTATATVSFTTTSGHGGGDVLKFGNSTGVGASAKSTTQSVALTTTKDSSAIVKFVTDWNALSGASRNSLTTGVGAFTETSYFQDTGRYTVYGGYHANVGAIGSKTVGYSAPTGMSANTLAVEVKGT